MNTATYDTLPTAAATNAAPALSGVPATTAARAADGAIVTSATSEPPSPAAEHDLPRRCRREPGEVERARAHLGAEHGVADDERRDRHHEPEDAVGGDGCERALRGFVDGMREQAEQERAGARHEHRHPPLPREARLQRVDEDRDERRSRPAPRSPAPGTLTGSAPGTSSRASRRARAPRASRTDSSRASRGSAVASSRARTVWITSPSRTASKRHAADRVERDQRGRQAPSVVGAHEHVPRAGRPSRRESRGVRPPPRAGRG